MTQRLILALVLGAYSLSAYSELIDRGGGFIYDDVLNITWTQDANINGEAGWANQVTWADDLSIVDSRPGAGGVTYNDWRLPSVDVNDDDTIVDCSSATELVCRDNEYGYLFHQYGITRFEPGIFTNFSPENYWSGTEFAPDTRDAWQFDFDSSGLAHNNPKHFGGIVFAVRSGDVAPVPIPAAAWLFGSALGLLGWMRRRSA